MDWQTFSARCYAFGLIALGFALATANTVGLIVTSILFVVVGLYIALVDAMEGAKD